MKTEKNILFAFVLNVLFSIFEFVGGALTNSVSILSDAIHDMGDALSTLLAYVLEKRSKSSINKQYTYGYARYSVLGSVFTTIVLIVGTIFIMYQSIVRIFHPVVVNYSGMIFLALFGVIINFIAVYATRGGDSLNQKSINLHMLEDVLGWVVVLIGAIIMKFTDISLIDPIMSILVAAYIFTYAVKNLREALEIFLEKVPDNIDMDFIKTKLLVIDGVEDIHHVHVWTMDGINNYATMHLVTKKKDCEKVKQAVKDELAKNGIHHCIIETESKICDETDCKVTLEGE